MTTKSLGLIETIGLTAAVEAADAAVKSANVSLIGYEKSKGSGMITIKVEGDVGAVKAAISAAESAALRIGSVVSTHVIPRPAEGLDKLIRNKETVGNNVPEPKQEVTESPVPEPTPEPKAETTKKPPVKRKTTVKKDT